MATSTDDLVAEIWGSPEPSPSIARAASERPSASPSRRPQTNKRPLFLPDSGDEDEDEETARASTSKSKGTSGTLPSNLNALFPPDGEDEADLPEISFAPMKDLAQLTKEAEARHARALPPAKKLKTTAGGDSGSRSAGAAAKKGSSTLNPLELELSDDEGDASKAGTSTAAASSKKTDADTDKKRKPIPKLDETRLLGEHGFRALLPVAKQFKPKGKGHEASDLGRVLEMYQLWAHRMYPKTQFRDTVERVEKLCHGRRMMTSLSVWRDEDKNGPSTSRPAAEGEADQQLLNGNDSSGEEEEGNGTTYTRTLDKDGRPIPRPEASRPPSSTASSPPPPPPRSNATSDIGDADLDDIMAELAQQDSRVSGPSKPSLLTPLVLDDDEEDMWAIADEMHSGAAPPKPPAMTRPPPPVIASAPLAASEDDDDDAMWGDLPEPTQEDLDMLMDQDAQPPSNTKNSVSPTVNNTTDNEGTAAMDIDTRENELVERRKSMMKEFEDGWDDMYE